MEERKMHYGELILTGGLLLTLIAIAVMLFVLIRSEERQERMLIERYAYFETIIREVKGAKSDHAEILKRCGE